MILHDEFAKIYMAIANIEDGLKVNVTDKPEADEMIAHLRLTLSTIYKALVTFDIDN